MNDGQNLRYLATALLAGFVLGCTSLAGAASPQPHGPTDVDGQPAHTRPKNVLVILTDDVGFAAGKTFGGPIETPTFDALAKRGLRFTNFHTTPMCSPTRAAPLTGGGRHRQPLRSTIRLIDPRHRALLRRRS